MKKPEALRILVVEDNPGDLLIVEDLLEEQFPRSAVVHAADFATAHWLMHEATESFDVVLLDLSLPDKSGQNLVTEFMQFATCPVIILTGFSDIAFSIKSLSQGISDYLLKEDLTAMNLHKSIVYSIERSDITSRLRESEKRYSDIFYLTPQPMWILDPKSYDFLQVNYATVALYGYSEEEFSTMNITDLKADAHAASKDHITHLLRNQSGAFKGSFPHLRKNGELLEVDIYSSFITIDKETFLLVVANDVTEKNQFEYRLTKAIIKTQEDERYEIGGELHDNVCQILATGNLRIGMLRSIVPEADIALLEECQNDIKLASREIRKLSHRLAPAFYDSRTLEQEFLMLLQTFNMEGKYKTSLVFDEAIVSEELDPEIRLNLYRIFQEQLKNILKYAQGSLVDVQVLLRDGGIRMTTSDNGVGFDATTFAPGIGIANMKRRAALFSGKFEIQSLPGKGCRMTVDLPLS